MASLSPFVKAQSKSKRVLPSVPAEKSESKGSQTKSVTFNAETIETSIGGSQSLGKLKTGVPLSPVNQWSSDDINFRGEEVKGGGQLNEEGVMNGHVTMLDDSANSVDFSIKCKDQCSEDKENIPTVPNVQGIPQISSSSSKHQDLEFFHFDPAYDMKMRTPIRRHTIDSEKGTPECYNIVHMDKPRYEMTYLDLGSQEDEEGSNSSVTVAVRVRPFSQRELADKTVRRVVSMCGNETTVTSDNGTVHRFAYDFSFWSFDSENGDFAGQELVHSRLAQPLLSRAFEGYNTCLFAYGQTGSGKSYSIMGQTNEVGIIPRFCEDLFFRAQAARDVNQVKISVEISFFEIYNEKIHDLLGSSKEKSGKKPTLKVREHPVLGPYVEGLSTFVVNSFEDVEGWITLGNKNRATAATGMNEKSSRSHSVFTIVLAQTKTEMWEGHEHDHSITSKINLVDLAGSERQSQAMTSGERLREGANINKSLLTLGKVISLLSEQSAQNGRKKKPYIPYRDSVLTWLLKESLGGNSKTTMIATISPANSHIEETLSTLRYAKQARSIVNVARVNEDPKAKLIRELRAEIEQLRLQTGNVNSEEAQTGTLAEIVCLRDQLKAREKEMEEMTRSWQERLKQSEERKLEESKLLEKAGITFKVDNKLPNLVNLNEDPQLSEMLLYVLKEGITRVGRMGLNSKHDIQLNGALIAENHCIINNVDLVVNITPIGDAPIYINGNLILEPTILHHGDRVILGGDHYFRFNHPIEVQKNKTESHTGPQEIRDFEFAKQELLRVQESRLQKELEEARRKAQEEMQQELERTRKMAEVELLSQKSDYDHKLSELEKVLKEQAEEKEQAEQSRQEAQGLVEKLRKQKMMLEQEVLAGRKRQQLEAEAAQKVALQTAMERSRILELLEAERQNAELKLEELRQRRNELMTSATRQPMVVEIPVGKKDLYKIALQLREANKISQYLKKHTVFSREDFLEGDQVRTTIKVTNTKLNVITHWTLVKFEEKLVQMRDLFQNEGENSSDDEVFTDPKDDWKNNSMSSPGTSPNLRNGHRYSSSPGLQPSLLSSLSSSGNSPQKSISEAPATCSSCSGAGVIPLCKEMVSNLLQEFQTNGFAESIADKVLFATETISKAVLYLKEKMGITEDNNNTKDKLDPWQYSTVQMYSVQMITCLNSLANHCVAWSAMYRSLNSTLIRDLIHRMTEQIRSMGGQLVHFLQACENSIDSLLDESSYKIQDCLQTMCKLTGELALATDTQMWCFEDMGNQGGTKEGDNNFRSTIMNKSDTQYTEMLPDHRIVEFTQQRPLVTQLKTSGGKVGPELCQSFFSGCEVFIDKTLQGALKTVEDYEIRAQSFTDTAADTLQLGDVPQNIEIVVSTSRVLLQKCQELQVEVDTSLQEGSQAQPIQLCGAHYKRSQALISHISSLVESVGLLIQTSEPVIEGKDNEVRKICKCADMIQKGAMRLTAVSGRDLQKIHRSLCESSSLGTGKQKPASRSSNDSRSRKKDSGKDCQNNSVTDSPSVSILSDSQVEQLEFACHEVQLSIASLIESVHKFLKSEKTKILMSSALLKAEPSTVGGKRMLPTPDKGGNSSGLVRNRSEQHNISLVQS